MASQWHRPHFFRLTWACDDGSRLVRLTQPALTILGLFYRGLACGTRAPAHRLMKSKGLDFPWALPLVRVGVAWSGLRNPDGKAWPWHEHGHGHGHR